MNCSTTLSRIQRLEFLKARVKSGEPTTVRQVATELGVSARTVSRDIHLLREQGIPIDADRGRGGGIRLQQNWNVGRIHLNYSEAVDLLVSLAVAEQMNSPLLMAHLKSVRLKLMASFSPAMSHKVKGLKARILIGQAVSPAVLSAHSPPNPRIVERIHQGFLSQKQATIAYRAENGVKSTRTIQPHFLLLCYPVWYVLAWDELRHDVRTFRCDRIQKIKLLEASFRLLPRARFAEALTGINAI